MTSKATNFGGNVSGATAAAASMNRDSSEYNPLYHHKSQASRKKGAKGNILSPHGGSRHTLRDATALSVSSHHNASHNNLSQLVVMDEAKAINIVRAKSTIKYGFGSNMTSIDPVQTVGLHQGSDKDNNDRLLFKVGNHVVAYDPDTNSQQFYEISKSTVTISHFIVSQNHKYLAVCEVLKYTPDSNGQTYTDISAANGSNNAVAVDDDPSMSVITIYDIKTLKKLKTLTRSSPKPQFMLNDFVMTSFTADSKLLVSVSDCTKIFEGEPSVKEVLLWTWEKERVFKSFEVPDTVTRVRGGSSNNIMVTASGFKHLKSYFIGSDSTIKSNSLLPPSREQDYDFVEHVWLLPHNGIHKIVVLGETSTSIASATSNTALPEGGESSTTSAPTSHNSSYHNNKKQYIFVFEGNEVMPTITATGMVMLTAPINLELRQTIAMKSLHNIGFRVENFAPCGKGFIVVGSYGHIAIYDRTDEKRDPYVEVKKFTLGHTHLVGAAVYQSEDKFNVIADSGRVLSLTMDASVHMRNALALNKDNTIPSSSRLPAPNMNANQDEFLGIDGSSVLDVIPGGFHTEPIRSADLAFNRPIMFTISNDRTARFWNYETLKCDLVYDFSSEEPLAAAIHASGLQVLVSFKDRVRLYNVLMDRLAPFQETIQKSCRDLKFSHGCQYWAGASGISVVVYETKSFSPLMTFQGHMMSVQRLIWAPGDQVLFSAGLDGNVYGWMINSLGSGSGTTANTSDNRLDVVTANNRSSTLAAVAIDCPTTSLYRPNPAGHATSNDDGPSNKISSEADRRSLVVLSSVDGNIKLPPFAVGKGNSNSIVSSLGGGLNSESSTPLIIPGDPRGAITSMCLTADRRHLIAGTISGTVRLYAWPPQSIEGAPDSAAYTETLAHTGAVISINIAPHQNTFITAGDDGTVFVHSLVRGGDYERTLVDPKSAGVPTGLSTTSGSTIIEADEPFRFNTEVGLVAADEIEEHVHEVTELNKTLVDLRAKHSYEVTELLATHAEELKKIYDRHESVLFEEQCKYENLKNEYDRKVHELTEMMDTKEVDYIKTSTELENRYEHKLADQLDRYDRLAEEMEALRQNCEALLREERLRAEKMLSDQQYEAHMKEKTLTASNKRLTEDKRNEANTFQEILEQQEGEYEDELRQLIGAAESELGSERDIVLNLRTIVQTKNTKLDQMKKKLEELNTTARARLKLLDNERAEKVRLMETLNHYKRNLREREDALSEKEKVISDLRNTTRTLENFRFVLDHRLQQLSAERGPITNHIERLERHIRTMYEELVEEFDLKKESADTIAATDAKLARAAKDVSAARYEISVKERYISSFKRDLENIIASMVSGKELEESMQQLHKKYVRNNAVGFNGSTHGDGVETVIEGGLLKGNPRVREKVEQLLTQNVNNSVVTPKAHVIHSKSGHYDTSTGAVTSPHGGAHNGSSFPTGVTNNMTTASSNNTNNTNNIGFNNSSNSNANSSNNNANNGSKRFIRDVEDALVDTAKESDRQRSFKEREANDLRHRLETAKLQAERNARRLVKDNNHILGEYNALRKHNKDVEYNLNIARDQLKDVQNQLLQLQIQGGTAHIIPDTGKSSASQVIIEREPRSTTPGERKSTDTIQKVTDSVTRPLSNGSNIHTLGEGSLSDSVASRSIHMQSMTIDPTLRVSTMPIQSYSDEIQSPQSTIGSIQGIGPSIGFDMRFQTKTTNPATVAIQEPRSVRGTKKAEGIAMVTLKLLEKKRKISLTPAMGLNEMSPRQGADKALSQSNSAIDLPKVQQGLHNTSNATSNARDDNNSNRLNKTMSSIGGHNRSKGVATASRQQELQVQRLEKEIELLHQSLDESMREKDMQRFEMGKMRRQVNELMLRLQEAAANGTIGHQEMHEGQQQQQPQNHKYKLSPRKSSLIGFDMNDVDMDSFIGQ